MKPLERWLYMETIYESRGGLQHQSQSKAIAELDKLRERPANLFRAMGDCQLERISQAERVLCKTDFGDNHSGMTAEAVNETLNTFLLLHDPTRYPAIFAAAAVDDDEEQSVPDPSKTPHFDSLKNQFHSALMRANKNFAKPHTQQPARERVLGVLLSMSEGLLEAKCGRLALSIKQATDDMFNILTTFNGHVVDKVNSGLKSDIMGHNL